MCVGVVLVACIYVYVFSGQAGIHTPNQDSDARKTWGALGCAPSEARISSSALVGEKHTHTHCTIVLTGQMAQSLKVPATKPPILSSEFDLQIHIVEAENCLLQVVLTSPHAP